MSNLIPFQFESNEIRVVIDSNGEPLFVGKDICIALGYSDPTNAMKQHCRGVVKYHPIQDSLGRTQEVRVLTEPDVLRLIVNCKLPAGVAFERLIFEEILPSIRKTGKYEAPNQPKKQSTLSHLKSHLLFAKHIEESLRLSETSKIRMYAVIAEENGLAS